MGERARALTSQGASASRLAEMVRATAKEMKIADNAYQIDTTVSPVTGRARLYFERGGMDFFHTYGPQE